ncbi:NUDIX hydrolase [Patescibacteria group bacterium]|nr:NUDIX hydrolase [Patescibacteria group bacterium]
MKRLMRIFGAKGTVSGIILDKQDSKHSRILLTKRSKRILIESGKWCLPGGHIKFGERAENAIKREIKEEIGLNLKNPKFLFYYDEIYNKLNFHCLNLVFEFKVSKKERPKINWEVSEWGWFNEEEIEKMNVAFSHKEIIKKFFKKEI